MNAGIVPLLYSRLYLTMHSECSNSLSYPLRIFAAYLNAPRQHLLVCQPSPPTLLRVQLPLADTDPHEFQVLVLLEFSKQERVLPHLGLLFLGCWCLLSLRGPRCLQRMLPLCGAQQIAGSRAEPLPLSNLVSQVSICFHTWWYRWLPWWVGTAEDGNAGIEGLNLDTD